MLIGDGLSPTDVKRVARAAEQAEELCGLPFTVYVAEDDVQGAAATGSVDERAHVLHATLADRDTAVLVYVDPRHREVVVVTGSRAAGILSDASCALATATMGSSFAAGDLAGGLVGGLIQLGEAARTPISEHRRPTIDR